MVGLHYALFLTVQMGNIKRFSEKETGQMVKQVKSVFLCLQILKSVYLEYYLDNTCNNIAL